MPVYDPFPRLLYFTIWRMVERLDPLRSPTQQGWFLVETGRSGTLMILLEPRRLIYIHLFALNPILMSVMTALDQI